MDTVGVIDALRAGRDGAQHLADDTLGDRHGSASQAHFVLLFGLVFDVCRLHARLHFLPKREIQRIQIRRVCWKIKPLYLQVVLGLNSLRTLVPGGVVVF